MNPSVSILIATYARTAMLAESLYSALNQRYDGAVEIVVLNSCPHHTLTCDARSVRIVNTPHLADAPLGLVRDSLMRVASGDVVCMWDDDDIYLPHHLKSLVTKLKADEPAARLRHMLTWDGQQFKQRGGSSNAAHTTLYRRAAYGTWPVRWDVQADSGAADNEFWMRCVQSGWFRGRHHHEADGILSCILRTDASRVRASQCEIGTLTPAQVRGCWNARFSDGQESRGVVRIVPAWSRDWYAESAPMRQDEPHV